MRGWYRRWFKRLFDMAIGMGGLCVFAIPMAWMAYGVYCALGPPVLFQQTRIGYRGVRFTVLKFRTMSETGTVTSSFCHWLRSVAMDELPQLINILKGEMSFVGPRPLIPEELEALDRMPCGAGRLSVRPGLAGLAQIYGAKTPALTDRLRWDLEYVDRCSFLLDLSILFKSLAITLRGAWEKPGPKLSSEEK